MARKLASLVVKLEAENGRLHRELEKSEQKIKGFSTRSKKSLSDLKLGFGALAGAASVGLAFRSVAKASIEQENALAQLNARLKSTDSAAGLTAQEITGMASSLQGLTTFGDESIIEMQNLLLTFTDIKKEGGVFEGATQSILDMSIAMNQDLKTSALQVGKALNAPVEGMAALSRVGVKFTDEQKDLVKAMVNTGDTAGAQKLILDELNKEFGGAAKAARDTFGGALTALGNAAGDLLETNNLGGAKDSVEDLIKVISQPGVQKAFGTITSGIFDIASAAANGLVSVVDFAKAIGEMAAGGSGFGVEADAIIEKIGELEKEIGGLGAASAFTRGAPSSVTDEIIAQKRAEIDALNKELDAVFSKSVDAVAVASPIASAATNQGGGLNVPTPIDPELQSKLEQQLAQIDSYNSSEFERLVAAHEARLEIIETNSIALNLSEERKNQLIEDTNRKHQENLAKIEANGLTEREKFEKANLLGRTKTIAGILANATAGVANQNKAMFRINQIAGVANAIVSTSVGITKALELGPLGIPLAAVIGAAGLLEINAIKNTKFGGSSSSGSGGNIPSFAGSVPASAAPAADNLINQPPPQNVSITVNSGIYDASSVRDLIEAINKEIGDGVNLNVDVA